MGATLRWRMFDLTEPEEQAIRRALDACLDHVGTLFLPDFKPLNAAIETAAAFAGGGFFLKTGNGYFGLQHHVVVKRMWRLLERTQSVDRTISWVLKVLQTEWATLNVVCQLRGVTVTSGLQLTDGIQLRPTSEHRSTPHWDGPSAELVGPIEIRPLLWQMTGNSEPPASREASNLYERMRLWSLALTVAMAHPVLPVAHWGEFVDPDIQFAYGGGLKSYPHLDLRPMLWESKAMIDVAEARSVAEGIGQAEFGWSAELERAAERFRRSMLQSAPLDGLLDLFLSLEIVLAGRGSQDGIVTRASHLLDGDADRKLKTYKTLSELQKGRNRAGHGAKPNSHAELQSLRQGCRPLVARVLSQCAAFRAKPDMEALQLGLLKSNTQVNPTL